MEPESLLLCSQYPAAIP